MKPQTNGRSKEAAMAPPAPVVAIHETVEPSTVVSMSGDALAECRVLSNRLKIAKERLGEADLVVADAETNRGQLRIHVARELQELQSLAEREAAKLGVNLKKGLWQFNPDTGSFTRV